MTATIRRPEPDPARRSRHGKRRVRFSFMESLGFIESPATVSRTWVPEDSIRIQPSPPPPVKRGAHERTIADLDPLDTTGELSKRNLRLSVASTVTVMIVGLIAASVWLWQRPAALAEAAGADVVAAASELRAELDSLRGASSTLTDGQADSSVINAAALSVDAAARDLFNASTVLPASQSAVRDDAASVAGNALDVASVLADAAAYRAAVIQVLVPPGLETDPSLIGLDDAIRQIGSWRLNFDRVRSALPEAILPEVSDQLLAISGGLESIQNRYVDGLSEDDQRAANNALLELAAQLEVAETLLAHSLAKTQEEASSLIEESLAGLERLLG